jgi:hypothetical protein
MEETKQPDGSPRLVPRWNNLHRRSAQERCEADVSQGGQITDPEKLFNTRLDSYTVRAIDIHQNESINDVALKNLIREAVSLNQTKAKSV